MAPVASQSIYRSRVAASKAAPSFIARVNSRFFGVGIFVMIGLIFMALLHTWFEIQVVNLGYSINKEMLKKDDLTQQIKLLSLEVAQLRSPNRIEALAKTELGMTVAGKQQMIFLSQLGNGTTGVSIAQLAIGEVQSLDQLDVESKKPDIKKSDKKIIAKVSPDKKKIPSKKIELTKPKDKTIQLAKLGTPKTIIVKNTPKSAPKVVAKNNNIKIADNTNPKLAKASVKAPAPKRVVPAVIIGH